MNRRHGVYLFESAWVENQDEGWVGMDLYCTYEGKKDRVARVIYWDATGEFTVETMVREVPLAILEALIVEAKATIAE